MADSGGSSSSNIKVVVRCRPMNSREKNRGASKLIEVTGQHQLVLNPPNETDTRENARSTKKKSMPFSFDRAYSEDTEQQELFEYVGLELLEHSFNGFNTCVFAYGQTGSGKSHSMVGYAEAKGLIPLTCSRLFDDANEKMRADPNLKITVEVSYIEIYNEKVRDLLNPKNKGNLRVREHPSLGPYVEDLSKLVVKDFNDIEHLMDEGNKARTVAATNMNETSSRSHAVFTMVVTQKRMDEMTKKEAEKVSRISLVDLAGSERANSTGATGSRLKEGANINKSLTTLGKVIAALAVASMEPVKGKKKALIDNFVPYRDSTLTWLLKDSLGGNSKTAMIAAISPADYEETLSTLRYADQAKKIKNKAVVNEDPNAKLIRELKEELEMLRSRATGGAGFEGEDTWDPNMPPEKQVVRYRTKTGEIKTVTKAELQDQMEQSEKLMQSLNQSWEQKVAQTQRIQIEREKALEEMGISVDKGNLGVHTPKKLPHLVNLNEDPLMSECLLYQLKPGSTSVGNLEGDSAQIRLSGSSILANHCTFENIDGVVTIHGSDDSLTMVNGKKVTADQPRKLRSGSRIILGDDFRHVFRFNNPEEVRKARDRMRLTGEEGDESFTTARAESPSSETNDGDVVDWTYARREAALAKLNGQDVSFEALNEDDLEKLYEDISRARVKKNGGTWRPDSVLSSLDDNSSETTSSELRPYSMSAYTDDTSMVMDPWFVESNQLSNLGTPNPEMETPQTLELKRQVKEYEEQLSKLALDHPGVDPLELPANYSERQKLLLRAAIIKWRRQTDVSMAEDLLSNAALLKEVNVISVELKKQVTYQFTIADEGALCNPTSSVGSIAGLSDLDDVADNDLAECVKPCVAVKVLDHAHSCINVWSIGKLEQRLHKMRNLYTFIDRPEYCQHFNWSDPFYEEHRTDYSFVGNALISLKPLFRQVSAKYNQVPIVSRYTMQQIGTCAVEVKFISLSPAPIKNGRSNGVEMTGEPIAGQKLGCQLSIDSISGLPHGDFEKMHVQVRLSSLSGQHSSDVYTSIPVEAEKDVKLRKTISFVLGPESIDHVKEGYAPIEFHAKLREPHLTRIERHDADQEKYRTILKVPTEAHRPSYDAKSVSSGRLSEKELIAEERHDVMASVQVCELDSSGEYTPVTVKSMSALDPGAFFLRQGLQRKIVINLQHDSGRQFPWLRVTKVAIGKVRLLDSKGKIHLSTLADPIMLKTPLKQQTLDHHTNGTSTLTLWTWWDSSVHDSIFLNRATAANHRVLLNLQFSVEVETCQEPVDFDMDIAVDIHPRDAKPPGKLYSMIESATSGSRVMTKTTNIFAIRLTPPMTKKSKELWRLDTSAKYVRGEESLMGKWKPRSVDLIHEHADFVKKERRSAEVQGVKALLQARPPLSLSEDSRSGVDERELLSRALASWQRTYYESKMSVLAREIDESKQARFEGSGNSLKNTNDNSNGNSNGSQKLLLPVQENGDKPVAPVASLRATVALVPRTETASKRGYLLMPLEAFTDKWHRRWFVLKRPYLYVYESSNEVDEVMVIHLGSVRVEHDENIAQMLGRLFVFGLYTSTNSYFLQAPSQKELDHWMTTLAIRARR